MIIFTENEIYILVLIVILSLLFMAIAAQVDKLKKRLKEYDKYFQCLGIGMTIDEMQKKGITKAKAKAPTCAPGGPEDYIKPPW